jgi:collagen type IV alpha-3-binding protein
MCHHFWSPDVRMEWEHTLDSTRVIEKIDKDTLIFHQIHKRVWPAAQRDACFWSHIRCIPNVNESEEPDWIVVNQSIDHDAAPVRDAL